MNYNILGSSSKGNCIILNNSIMLDCGISYSKVKPYLKDIDLIFISHRHFDHLLPTCVKQINNNFPTIKFVCNLDVAEKLNDLEIKDECIWCLREDKWYDLGFAKVKLEQLVHDAHNSSIQIEYKNGGKVLYITDTKEIPNTINAKDYDLYLIEANYKSKEEYLKKIEEAKEKGEYTHLIRALETHLCEEDAIKWLKDNIGDKSEFAFIHQHEIKEGENKDV